jgi:hypothetical protein
MSIGQGSGWRRREPRESRRGVEFIPIGESTLQVHFDPPMEEAPTHVICQLYRPETLVDPMLEDQLEDAALRVLVIEESITAHGFKAHFQNASAGGFPISGLKLAWEAF